MPDGGARPTGLGPCDILTIEEAARALRMRDADADTWLRARGLVRMIAGRERVPWGAVYRLIESEGAEPVAAPKSKPGRTPRTPAGAPRVSVG